MNPLTQTRNLTKLIEREIKLEVNEKASWHYQYKDSAWIFVGGLEYGLNEGDLIAVFSQYGEVVNINLVRDKKTGKSKGYCFLCYEDQRSTILAVDNFNGIKLCKRIIRVDHVENYRVPKDFKDTDEETKKLRDEGCGPDVQMNRDGNEKLKDRSPAEVPVIKEERQDPGYEKYEILKETRKESDRSSHSKVDSNKRKRENSKERHLDKKTSHAENVHDKHSKDRCRDDRDYKRNEKTEERRNSRRKSERDNEKSASSKDNRISKKRENDYDSKRSYNHKHSKRKY